ncbi:UNVERIFIED_CONTAM: Retrovirus-related Pol polyprotein from transposon [Sesamum calycinum]|uniref:Retrovirus-related Pol polyprotein from transposon n=1 Tax=Sesamum calycinum TaxID=2727403 RepID=A0AAW2KF79_9LAMI
MPDELPQKLPPKRAVITKYELVPGMNPPVRAPYRMSQPKLVELRKQLKEMLESNKYPIPLVADCFDRLSRAKYFTKIDLRSGYWQVRIKEADEAKTTVVTSMSFRVSCHALRPEERSRNLQHYDEPGTLWREDVFGWTPRKFRLLRSGGHRAMFITCAFLWLANYYRHFVKGYSEIARPMTDLLKKRETWDWTPQCQVAFDNLKRAMVTDPVLALPDMSKPFTVETDASDFALGGLLLQDGHPVAFESRKLKDIEWRYSVHEKELLAVVHCLRLWRHYLLGSPFVVKTDNTAVSHFMSQPNLTVGRHAGRNSCRNFILCLSTGPAIASMWRTP